jgi:hypothetical protein
MKKLFALAALVAGLGVASQASAEPSALQSLNPAATPAANSVTLTVSRPTVTYGTAVAVRGSISPAAANQTVTITADPAKGATRQIAAKTQADGTFSVRSVPLIRTEYTATWGGASSQPQIAFVRPRIVLKKLSRRALAVSVYSLNRLVDRPVHLNRWSKRKRQYVPVKTALLGKTKRSTIFQARFNLKMKRGQRFRATMRARDAGFGYLFGQSNVVGIR